MTRTPFLRVQEVCGSAPLGLGKLVELNPNTKKWGSIVASNLEPVTIAEYFDAHLTRNASTRYDQESISMAKQKRVTISRDRPGFHFET